MECKDKNSSKKLQSFPRGFSLIELLVVISISIGIMSLGYANYRSFGRKKNLEKITNNLKSDLILAREYALSGRKPDPSLGPCNSLESYEVQIFLIIYRVVAVCSDGNSYTVKTVDFGDRILVLPIPIWPITFRVLGRGVESNSDITITLYMSGTANQIIKVTRAGQIR